MKQPEEQTRTVVIEKTFAHPPEKLWRAITDPVVLEQWLLPNNFLPEIGRAFQLRSQPVGGWDGVTECRLVDLEPPRRIAYSWRAPACESTVQFTLIPTEGCTRLRMEHSGFTTNQYAAYQGAQYGWYRFIGNLERLLEADAHQ